MDNYFVTNRESIQQTSRKLKQGLLSYSIETLGVSECVYSEPARKEGYTMYFCKDEEFRRMNSEYSPTYEATMWSLQYQGFSKNGIIYIIGLGNGYFVDKLLDTLDPGVYVVIYEPSKEIFFHAMANYDLCKILKDERIFLVVEGINESVLGVMLGIPLTTERSENVMLMMLPQYEHFFSKEANSIQIMIEEKLRMLSTSGATKARFGLWLTWFMYSFWELLENQLTVPSLKKSWPKDIPVIIVGAGPSLGKNIDLLKEVKGKAIVIGLDSALPALYEHGIDIDFYMCVESKKPLELFDEDKLRDVPMFCRKSIWPHLQGGGGKYPGRKIYVKDEEYIESVYEYLGIQCSQYNFYGSVGTAAFAVAAELGAKTIVLIGQDLAYSQSGSAHVKEREAVARDDYTQDERYLVEGYDGTMIQSRYDWYGYLKWTEESISILDGVTVINATEGGAKIKGAIGMSLRDTIDQYCQTTKVSVADILQQSHSPFDGEVMKKLNRFIEKTANERISMRKDVKKGIKLCQSFLRELHFSKYLNEKVIRISEDTERLDEKLRKHFIYSIIKDSSEAIPLVKEERTMFSEDEVVEGYLEQYYDLYCSYRRMEKVLKNLVYEGDFYEDLHRYLRSGDNCFEKYFI